MLILGPPRMVVKRYSHDSMSERSKKIEGRESITELLLKWSDGENSALEQLMPLVYDELRRLAVKYLRHERPNHTLQPTALVNEAYMRLVDQHRVEWQNRAQFFGFAAKLMRNILVDHARTRQTVRSE